MEKYICPQCGFNSNSFEEIAKEKYLGNGASVYICKKCGFQLGDYHPMSELLIYDSVTQGSNKKFGVFLGRMQPIHKGHIANIQQIINDGLEPIVIIGSSNKLDDRNPLTIEQREELIYEIFPTINIYSSKDFDNWDTWFKNIETILIQFSKYQNIPFKKENFIFYVHKKEKDKCSFIYKNKKYFDNYQKIFEIEGYKIKELEDVLIDNEIIHATKIRQDKEYAKKVLPENIYNKLCNWLFWGIERFNENDKYKIIEYTNWFKVYGGDGTLLRAINKFYKTKKPFFGIGKGTKNFLMNDTEIIKDPVTLKFKLLEVIVDNHKEIAFNEVMIGNTISDWIEFEIYDKDGIIGNFKGGGVIISTPQGSTGINKSAGGVILPLESKDWVVTGILTDRKIHYVIEPQNLKIRFKSRNFCYLWMDGKIRESYKIDAWNEIEIKQSKEKVKLMFNNIDDFKSRRRL
jgi:NAD+ kinase